MPAAWVAGAIFPTISYGVIATQMVLCGLGMGFTSSPATEAIMDVVPKEKAGVGSPSTTPPACSATPSAWP